MTSRLFLGKIFFLLFFFLSCESYAQQTIFNVPSADILEKGKNFLQHESQFRTKDPKQFYNTLNYYARGIGYNTELDVTQMSWSAPASNNVTIGVGTKTAIPWRKDDPYEIKTIVGFMLPISLQGKGAGHWAYITQSFVLPQTGTRFTAGFNSGSRQVFGKNVNSFIGGIEQKVTDKFSLIGDWYSGKHGWGQAALGFSYALPRDFTFYGGYQITNSKRELRNSFVIEIATIF